jgi:hypothetical protein
MWIDGDVWVQQWDGIDLFLRAASDGSLAIATHRHHAYVHAGPGVAKWHLSRMRAMFGEAMMSKWMFRPSYNAGVFAMHANAPHWSVWADYFQKALARAGGRLVGDQVPLSIALFESGLPVHPLPSTCNWLCHLAPPAWDREAQRFCEPTLPHHPLHLIHLTADTADRRLNVQVLGGSTRSVHVRFSSPRP